MTPEPNNQSTLGEFLRQEREKKGISLDQVSSETKIAVRVLQYLEKDEYQHLPAKPFIRGFIISYARFLELNPREILLQYKEFIDQKCKERPDREKGLSGYAFERKEGEGNQQLMLWLILGAFVLVGGVVLAIVKPSFKHRRGHGDRLKQSQVVQPSPSPSEEAPEPEEPKPKASPKASPKVAEPVVVTPSPSPGAEKPDPLNSGVHLKSAEIVYKVIFKAQDDVWVRYSVDDRPPMKFILRKDKVLVLRAAKALRFQTSLTDQMTYNYNSRGAKPLHEAKSLIQFASGDTLYLSENSDEKSHDPFEGQKPLPKTVPPQRRTRSNSVLRITSYQHAFTELSTIYNLLFLLNKVCFNMDF